MSQGIYLYINLFSRIFGDSGGIRQAGVESRWNGSPGEPRGGRSTDAGRQICHESLTAAISEPRHRNGISTHTDTTSQDVQM
jgi:hypothetical protein